MLEILAPAGNEEAAKAAIHSGANAIYLGYSAFSARQGADNFPLEKLKEIVAYAHFCGVKVYVAMNTMIKEQEIDEFLSTLLSVWALGVDSIILQDILLGKQIHERYPDIVLHLSTQAGVCNENGAIFAKECGFSRVILARETPLFEIGKIAKIIETEAFVQGALCTCFSGECYFSSFIGGNSGNRGRCKQPCRKKYAWNRSGFEEERYALSLSDLCVGEDIFKYIDAGVCSFKIEGRMRRAEYVSAAVEYYKTVLDNKDGANTLSNLKRTYNRGNYTKGLAFGQDKRFLSTAVQGHIGEKVGVVKVINGKFFVDSRFQAKDGDAFKILRDGKEIGGANFCKLERNGFVISSKVRLKNGDSVFITTDGALNERLLQKTRRGNVLLSLYFCEGERAEVSGEGIKIYSQDILQTATSRPLTKEDLQVCFLKTDGLPIDVTFEKIDIIGNIFIPKSTLNAIRREYFEKLSIAVLGERKKQELAVFDKYIPSGKNDKIAVIASDFQGVQADIAIYKPNEYAGEYDKAFINGNFEKYVYYPPLFTSEEEQNLAKIIKEYSLDGVYAENYSAIIFAREHGCKIFVGTGLNVANTLALSSLLKNTQISHYAISKELNKNEMENLVGERAFVLSSGNIKLMDLCYCPFGKSCLSCDKKREYTLTDENGRIFPVRRYTCANGECRFEVYNCADMVGTGANGFGKLIDLTIEKEKNGAILAANDIEKQKHVYKTHTSGHWSRGVL